MEELKRVALIAGNVLNILLGEDLPDPRIDIPNEYSYFNS